METGPDFFRAGRAGAAECPAGDGAQRTANGIGAQERRGPPVGRDVEASGGDAVGGPGGGASKSGGWPAAALWAVALRAAGEDGIGQRD